MLDIISSPPTILLFTTSGRGSDFLDEMQRFVRIERGMFQSNDVFFSSALW